MEEYIMTIDEGTTSARAVLFNKDSEIIAIMCERVCSVLSTARMGGAGPKRNMADHKRSY